MLDNIAINAGYTKHFSAYPLNNAFTLSILVKPDTDFDTRIKVWDCDEQDYIYISGWLFEFTESEGF